MSLVVARHMSYSLVCQSAEGAALPACLTPELQGSPPGLRWSFMLHAGTDPSSPQLPAVGNINIGVCVVRGCFSKEQLVTKNGGWLWTSHPAGKGTH